MFTPLVAAVSVEEFVAYDLELQVSMFESLVRVYGIKFLPDWLRAVYCYALDMACAEKILRRDYPALLDFAATYRNRIAAEFADYELAEEDSRQAAEFWYAQEYELAA
jgi:hypothetical protein